jgi:hypothetical protein
MSNLQLFDTNLSAPQVLQLYNNGTPLTTAIASDNLKAWYKLDNNEKFDGTNWSVENQKYPAGFDSALFFDGNNFANKITLNSSISTGNNYSVSFWLNPKSVVSGNSYIFSDSTTSPYKGLALDQGSSTAGGFGNFYYYTGSVVVVNNTAISGDVWSHIAIVFDVTAQEIKFYINGSLDKTTTSVANIGTLIDEFGIRLTSNAFNGKLSNIAIFTSELDLAAVQALYNNGTPETSISSSPVSWWKLNNLTTGIQDSAGSNDGTNNGATKVNTFVSTEAG